MAEGARVGGAGAARASALKVAPAVLIGIASLLGALVAWHAAQVSGSAGGADSASVAQQQVMARDLSQATVVANTEATAYVRYQVSVAASEELEGLAEVAQQEGRFAAAAELSGEAVLLGQSARVIVDRYGDFSDTEVIDPVTGRFDVEARRDQLVLQYPRARHEVAPTPERAATAASDQRSRTLDLGVVVLVLAVTLFVLTLAELGAGRWAAGLTVVGGLLLLGSAVGAGVLW